MSSFTLLQMIAGLWAGVLVAYLLLLMYRAMVGLHEDDSLHISAAEAGFETEQCEIRKQIGTLEVYSHRLGIAVLAVTAVLVCTVAYQVAQNL